MRKHVLGLFFLLVSAAPAFATNCVPFTYTLTNGTTADANQVMANFNTLLNCSNNNLAHNGANSDITQLTGLTTPLSVPQGGTGLSMLTAHAVPIGNAASTPNFAAPSTAGYVLTDNGASADPSFTAPITSSTAVNSLATNVSLTNTSLYFDGPSVAQGSSGTWFASGTITAQDTSAGSGQIQCKLWDGTTVIAGPNNMFGDPTAGYVTIALSGLLAAPAANIKISCNDSSHTSNAAIIGGGKTSTLTAVRLQ